ncbi:uncharacterized protein BJ171DRAFT_510932 [Polychytrium aggregatum]|uniref:uncharacterized protein n=1 Tax=Polychytrium aggregatum TaxID=110093 RepID=UPI0022FDFCBC|nr:uncharacterized protein BJ171DRAFT_510932 [Polychytrium aggregatum]KAI9203122.1 hypothetical protein BJ171DRAFT_510932 [Polychytrium aggregatum]
MADESRTMDEVDPHAATVTVRLIKSFDFRTFKNVVLHDVDLTTTTTELLRQIVEEKIKMLPGMRPYHNHNFDTLKLYTKAHGSKTQNLIINLDHEDWFLDPSKTLLEQSVANETEISYFNRVLYEEYKKNPEVKW